jgi:hydrogenase expression/formation protein HypD
MAKAEPASELKFRDPGRARALAGRLRAVVTSIGRPKVSVMHVCGSHEQAIARFGLRAVLPPALELIMGPGCPVCVTDGPEVDEAVALALSGARVCTYGDMLRLPGASRSLADAQSEGGKVEVVYSAAQAAEVALAHPDEEVVFFASGFETTAVATAAVALGDPPANLSILSAHKYVPSAMDAVAEMPDKRIEGFLAAGHAAVITGSDLFAPFARRTSSPVVVTGFEPLDILAALVKVAELIRDGRAEVANMYPRCVTGEGNRPAQEKLWKVFERADGTWRGIGSIPGGNLALRPELARLDAHRRLAVDLEKARAGADRKKTAGCICGLIMTGRKSPHDCPLFGKACVPSNPVGACMVSSEGTCRIWHQYGGMPDLRKVI